MMPSLRPTISTLSGRFNEVTGRYMIDAISSRKALTWPVWRRNSWPRRPHGHSNRVSLLRAAAYHGSSHQAAMTFQVIVPKQLRDFEIGRHRLQFVYQSPAAFAQVNQPDLLGSMKSDAGFANIAGIGLTLLDCARDFHKSGASTGLPRSSKTLERSPTPANSPRPPRSTTMPPSAGSDIC